jgi:hypothetical protein
VKAIHEDSSSMAKGNTKFTTRARAAVAKLWADADLSLLQLQSGSLFSPVFRNGDYEWVKLMDSDGTLVAPRKVKTGEGTDPVQEVELLIGVVIQSEDASSQTKPNPFGKAAIGHVRNGVWVDIEAEGRRRLDRVHVLMLLPKGAAPKHQKSFATAKRNVENAADLMPDCDVLEVPRGIRGDKLYSAIKTRVRPWFKGRGRPKAS